ncbi:hypothetical protein pb186bvf_008202 [Paramecium bursaria]
MKSIINPFQEALKSIFSSIIQELEYQVEQTEVGQLLSEKIQNNIHKIQTRLEKLDHHQQRKQQLDGQYESKLKSFDKKLTQQMQRSEERKKMHLFKIIKRTKKHHPKSQSTSAHASIEYQKDNKAIQQNTDKSPKQSKTCRFEAINLLKKKQLDEVNTQQYLEDYENNNFEFFQNLQQNLSLAEERRIYNLNKTAQKFSQIDQQIQDHKERQQKYVEMMESQKFNALISKFKGIPDKKQILEKQMRQSSIESRRKTLRVQENRKNMLETIQPHKFISQTPTNAFRQRAKSVSVSMNDSQIQNRLYALQLEQEQHIQEILLKNQKLRLYNQLNNQVMNKLQQTNQYFSFQIKNKKQ